MQFVRWLFRLSIQILKYQKWFSLENLMYCLNVNVIDYVLLYGNSIAQSMGYLFVCLFVFYLFKLKNVFKICLIISIYNFYSVYFHECQFIFLSSCITICLSICMTKYMLFDGYFLISSTCTLLFKSSFKQILRPFTFGF